MPSYQPAFQPLRSREVYSWTMRGCLAVSLILTAISIQLWGAAEVRADWGDILFLTVLGAFWIGISQRLFFWLGLSVRDDAVDGKNPAALVALGSATLAIAIVFAAGNLGEGLSYWNNIFSAALGTAGLLALWFIMEFGARVSVSIAEERNLASGVRFGGFLLASGLIIGRAVAGDWHSESATVHDFLRDGRPAAGLCIMAFLVEIMVRPDRKRPFPPLLGCGLVPALSYLAFAAVWVCHLGRWEGMPK